MYFGSRAEAGILIAEKLQHFRYENTVVVALDGGAVLVGQQIAASLHCILTLFLSEEIDVPGENLIYGTLNQSGRFTYNSQLSEGEVEAYYSEYHGYFEEQRRKKMSKLNELLGAGGIVDEAILREQTVILVSDGLRNGSKLDAAADFLKPLRLNRLVIVAPIASVPAVDRAHVVSDEIHILHVTGNYLDTDHYYDLNDVPDHEGVIAMLNDVVLEWR